MVLAPGPPWWTVTNGDHKAYILGSLASVPFDQHWTKGLLAERIQGAQAVVLPPVLSGAAPLKSSTKPAPLPADLADRLTKIAIAVGMPPARYQGKSAIEAGSLLLIDFSKSRGDGHGVVANAVAHKAQELGVPVTYASVIRPGAYEGSLAGASQQAGLACLTEALNEVQAGPGPFEAAINGWAQGDVRRAMSAPAGLALCGSAIPRQDALKKRANAEQVAAIERALKPGPAAKDSRTVFVVDLDALMSKGGVLDQLRALHYDIEAPASAR